jgi:hypothetical protein
MTLLPRNWDDAKRASRKIHAATVPDDAAIVVAGVS